MVVRSVQAERSFRLSIALHARVASRLARIHLATATGDPSSRARPHSRRLVRSRFRVDSVGPLPDPVHRRRRIQGSSRTDPRWRPLSSSRTCSNHRAQGPMGNGTTRKRSFREATALSSQRGSGLSPWFSRANSRRTWEYAKVPVGALARTCCTPSIQCSMSLRPILEVRFSGTGQATAGSPPRPDLILVLPPGRGLSRGRRISAVLPGRPMARGDERDCPSGRRPASSVGLHASNVREFAGTQPR